MAASNGTVEDTEEVAEAWKRLDQITDKLYKEGFREGIDPDQAILEKTLQESFDEGYREAFSISKDLSALQAALAFRIGLCQDGGRLSSCRPEIVEKLTALKEEVGSIYKQMFTPAGERAPKWEDRLKSVKDVTALRLEVDTLLSTS